MFFQYSRVITRCSTSNAKIQSDILKNLSIEYSCLSLIFQSFNIYCLWLDIDCYFRNSAMKWTKEHNVLLGKKVMLFELQKYKLGSERGNCLDQIAKSLNQLQEPFFNVSQKSITDRLRLLKRDFKMKDWYEWKGSGISSEKSEIHVIMEDYLERKEEQERESEKISDKTAKEKASTKERQRKEQEMINHGRKENIHQMKRWIIRKKQQRRNVSWRKKN